MPGAAVIARRTMERFLPICRAGRELPCPWVYPAILFDRQPGSRGPCESIADGIVCCNVVACQELY